MCLDWDLIKGSMHAQVHSETIRGRFTSSPHTRGLVEQSWWSGCADQKPHCGHPALFSAALRKRSIEDDQRKRTPLIFTNDEISILGVRMTSHNPSSLKSDWKTRNDRDLRMSRTPPASEIQRVKQCKSGAKLAGRLKRVAADGGQPQYPLAFEAWHPDTIVHSDGRG